MSLVVPYHLKHHRALPVPHLRSTRLVRFCIGLEAVQDLQQDMAQALAQLN